MTMRVLSIILLALMAALTASADDLLSISYNEASQVCSGSVSNLNLAPLTYSTSCVPTAGATIDVRAEGSLSTVRLGLFTTGPSQNTQAGG